MELENKLMELIEERNELEKRIQTWEKKENKTEIERNIADKTIKELKSEKRSLVAEINKIKVKIKELIKKRFEFEARLKSK